MNYLFEFAVDAGYMNENPARSVKKPKLKGEGLPAWTEQDVIRFLKTHEIGTKAHLAISLFLWTGLSRSDAWQIGPQRIKDGFIIWDREKTGTPQYIPVLPQLQNAINSAKGGQLALLLTEHGRLFKSAAALGNKFSDWCHSPPE